MPNRYLLAPLVALLLLAAAPHLAHAQTGAVGIGTAAPDASAMLDISSTGKGLLPPRLTMAQRDAIGNPAAGLTIYNTTTNKLNTWNGTSWVETLTATEQPSKVDQPRTFGYTRGAQTYTVPAGVTSVRIDATGAQGGGGGSRSEADMSSGGRGARVQATLAVTPGEVLTVYVGEAGTRAGANQGVTTFNGGGYGQSNWGRPAAKGSVVAAPAPATGSAKAAINYSASGGSGGGASDVRRSAVAPSTALTERLLVAAGGGGGGGGNSIGVGPGGAGGAPFGQAGGAPFFDPATGGTHDAGGSYDGALGRGGNALKYVSGISNTPNTGGGGGGGYYGGGGSGAHGGGGGGSSWVTPTGSSDLAMTAGYQTGYGLVVITPLPSYAAPALDARNFVNLPGGVWTVSGADAYRPTGHVGIGTATPLHPLTVQAGSTAAGSPLLGFHTNAGSDKYNFSLQGGGLNLSESNVAGARLFAQETTGNVGIGTSSPGYRLDVAGGLRAAGDSRVGSNSLVGGRLGVGIGTGTSTIPTSTLEVRTTTLDFSAAVTVGSLDGGGGAFYFGNSNHGLRRNFGDQGLDVGLYTTAGSVRLSASNGTPVGDQFVLNTNGQVGIGTASPNHRLDVAGTARVSGNLRVGRLGIGTGSSGLSSLDEGLSVRATERAAMPTVGGVYISGGAAGNANLELRGGTPFLDLSSSLGSQDYRSRLLDTGGGLALYAGSSAAPGLFLQAGTNRVGIGTGSATPIAPLHVRGVATTLTAGSTIQDGDPRKHFINPSGGKGSYDGPDGEIKNTVAYFEYGVVWVNNYVVAGALNTTSDRRIKHVVGRSAGAADLALLNRLRITDYTYIDQVNNTNQLVKKVIAQEVEQVLPQAVSRSRQALPDVYEKATRVHLANGVLTVTMAKAHGLPAAGGRMRFYTPANESLDPEVAVVDAHTVRFASTEDHAAGLFVYGKYVDDFRSVDYDALSMLNVSASQELARKVAALEAENAALQAQAAAANAEAREAKEQTDQATAATEAFAARLRALEAATGGQARRNEP